MNYMEKHLGQLVGRTVTGLVADPEFEEDFGEPAYGLKFDNGSIAWILRDPEGNGPGFLDIVRL